MPDEMSPGEIGRHLGRLEAQIDAGFKDIKSDLSNYVLKSVHEAEMKGVEARFGEVEKDLALEVAARVAAENAATARTRWVVGLMVPVVTALVIAVLNIYF